MNIDQLRELVVERRNQAHINCIEEAKQAYQDVLCLIDNQLFSKQLKTNIMLGQTTIDVPSLEKFTDKQPEFKRILDQLKEAASENYHLVQHIAEKVSLLHRQGPKDVCEKEGVPQPATTITDLLWAEVWGIGKTNEDLRSILRHLENLL